ncbi:MAG: OmpA family protein [Pseudomonadota bacterium]
MKLQNVIVGAGLLLGACSTSPFTGEEKISNTAIGTGAGAVAGATAGILIDGSRKAALIGAGIGALTGGSIGLYMDKQEADLRNRLRDSGVSVTRVGNDIILNMPSNITFDVNRSEIKPQFYEVLNSVAIVLNEYNQSLVDITGHTDSDGSDGYNQELSEKRAASVSRYLVTQLVDGRRLETRGAGETQPVAPNTTQAGKAQNRRVEIKIVPLTA